MLQCLLGKEVILSTTAKVTYDDGHVSWAATH